MKRNDIVLSIANSHGVSQNLAAAILNTVELTYRGALLQGEEVYINHVGKLKPAKRSARVGRNPSTGEPINIPAKTTFVLKPSTSILQTAN